ncbi:hypothetical protein [Paenibacillus silagei]|uniref:Uncharacterized protein n=1 Tax=Paenibacillus silagei TaxID=1670801 RepID=A0ABS4NVZ1_9BACL|nr:hypothetical protein [Paenibacillus silagei]MBP2114223.1 hypothetical protein [Paenibacillus silagei]
MGNDLYRKLGAAFLITAALIYTIECVGTLIARSHEFSALYEANLLSFQPKTHIAGFFDNLFVPILTLIGVILFVYGFPKKTK